MRWSVINSLFYEIEVLNFAILDPFSFSIYYFIRHYKKGIQGNSFTKTLSFHHNIPLLALNPDNVHAQTNHYATTNSFQSKKHSNKFYCQVDFPSTVSTQTLSFFYFSYYTIPNTHTLQNFSSDFIMSFYHSN